MEVRSRDEIFREKDIRMARMNNLTNATNMIMGCIQAGIVKPKDLDMVFVMIDTYRHKMFDLIYDGMKATAIIPGSERGDSVGAEGTVSPPKPSAHTPPNLFVCERCGGKITQAVSDFSLKNFNRGLCILCQKIVRDQDGID